MFCFNHSFPHRTSLQFGITALKRMNYDRIVMEERRKAADESDVNLIVWSNERVIRWVVEIGLKVIYTEILSIPNYTYNSLYCISDSSPIAYLTEVMFNILPNI